MRKLALTTEEKARYVALAHAEFARIGQDLGIVATLDEAMRPNPDCLLKFWIISGRAEIENMAAREKAVMSFGFGQHFDVSLNSDWFEEDEQGEPTMVKNQSIEPFLRAVFGGILRLTDPTGVASREKVVGALFRAKAKAAEAAKVRPAGGSLPVAILVLRRSAAAIART